MRVAPVSADLLIKAAIALAVVGVVWYSVKKVGDKITGLGSAAGDALAEVSQAYEHITATMGSAWNNNIASAFAAGQSYADTGVSTYAPRTDKWSDYAYTGIDPITGKLVNDGEWYGNADALRYDYLQPAAAKPAATSIHGAAFGIYPRP